MLNWLRSKWALISLAVGLFISLAFSVILSAWTDPTQPPPLNNVSEPINVSTSTQAKAGHLYVGGDNGSAADPDLWVYGSASFGVGAAPRFYFDRITGNVGIGITTPATNPIYKLDIDGGIGGEQIILRVKHQGSAVDGSNRNTFLQVESYSGGTGFSALGSHFRLTSARGTMTTPSALTTDDRIGSLLFSGYDGSNFQNPAALFAKVDNIVSTGSVPSKITFETGACFSGCANPRAERMVITSSGNVGIGTTTPSYKLDVNGDLNLPSTGFIRIAGNAGSSGQVLTRTSTGMAWQTVSGSLPSGCSSSGEYLIWNGSEWTCSATTTVPDGIKYVFVTAAASPRGDMRVPWGTLTGIDGADYFCQYVADTYGTDLIKGKVWLAALSSSGSTTTSGSHFTRGCQDGVNYYYPDGSPTGLTQCPTTETDLASVITKNESGGSVGASTYKWVGTYNFRDSCDGWTTSVCTDDFKGLIANGRGNITYSYCCRAHPIVCWEKISQAPTNKIVFITSTFVDGGNLNYGGKTGIEAANQICQDRANAGGLGGIFKAWISDSITSARNNIACHNTKRYVLRTQPGWPEVVIADNCDDLIDGSIDNNITRDEFGNSLVSKAVWTGTLADGSADPDKRNCTDWTVNQGGICNAGSSDYPWKCAIAGANWTTSNPNSWTQQGTYQCNARSMHFYCFQL